MIELNVNGMTCGGCATAVTRAVQAVDTQAEVRVDLATRRVLIDGQGSADEYMRALAKAGYPATPAEAAAGRPAARRGCCCS